MRNEEAGRTEERDRQSRGGGGKEEIVFVMGVCEQFVWRFWRSVRYGIGK
jgi:hypothetical protein